MKITIYGWSTRRAACHSLAVLPDGLPIFERYGLLLAGGYCI